jgi:hypothetical protein
MVLKGVKMKTDHNPNGPQFPKLKIELDRGEAYELSQIIDETIEAAHNAKLPIDEKQMETLNELDYLLFEFLNKYI